MTWCKYVTKFWKFTDRLYEYMMLAKKPVIIILDWKLFASVWIHYWESYFWIPQLHYLLKLIVCECRIKYICISNVLNTFTKHIMLFLFLDLIVIHPIAKLLNWSFFSNDRRSDCSIYLQAFKPVGIHSVVNNTLSNIH